MALCPRTIFIMGNKMKKPLVVLATSVFWLAVWWILSGWIGQEILLPSPWVVFLTVCRLCRTAAFWQAVGVSLWRVLSGFVAAVVAGALLAVATCRFRLLHTVCSPLLHVVRAAPVASFIILAYFWIRLDVLPAFIAFLMVLPMVWANVAEGIRQTDRRLLEMAKVYRLGFWRTVRHVWVPSVRPYFLTACTTGLGFAWKSGIAAEVICSPARAIGSSLGDAKAYLQMPEVFAWTVTVVLLSVLLERGLVWLVYRHKQEVTP